MRKLAGIALVALVALPSCGEDAVPPDGPGFSINGGNCKKTLAPRALTVVEQAGSGMPDKTLAFTFDDGPSEVTSDLSDYLKSKNIVATFFVNGANIEGGGEPIIDKLVADGHLIANHTQTHASLPDLADDAAIVKEVEDTDKLIASKVPAGKLFFRPPFGGWNEKVQKALDAKMSKYIGPVGWDIGDALTADTAADWDCWSTENGTTKTFRECGDLYTKEIRAKKKGVVLLHDGPPGSTGASTLAMVKYIVPLLQAEGYKFVRVDAVDLKPLTVPNTGEGGGTQEGGEQPGPVGEDGRPLPPAGQDPCK